MNKIIFCLGLFFCLFPLVSRGIEQHRQEDVIATYEENVRNLEQNELAACVKCAKEYNQAMFEMNGILMQDISTVMGQEDYEKQLNLFENGIMGSIEIPKIHVNLPIYHGTGEEVLSVGVGHLQESSLPVGGINTHSVLTGHRGLPNSQLFTRLDEMKEGDLFFLHIYKWTLAYKVCDIEVIAPENGEILEIQQGEDKVSLITCTPYGINTHRLVVTGRRTAFERADYAERKTVRMSWREMVFTVLPFVFVGIALAGQSRQRRNRRMKRRKRRRTMMLLLFLLCMWTVPAAAESKEEHVGAIEIQLTDGEKGTSKENVKFSYAKVGTLENGIPVLLEKYKESGVDLSSVIYADELEKAARKIQQHVKDRSLISTDQEGKAVITGLEEGVYLIEVFDKAKYETVTPMLITMPMWDEEEKKMNYEITVIPKHSQEVKTPKTGDSADSKIYIIMAAALARAIISVYQFGRKK